MSQTYKPRLASLRFSLRTLLESVTIASAGFGWLGLTVRRVQEQKAAVLAIRELGGTVYYGYQLAERSPPGPKWLRDLVGLDFLNTPNSVYFPDGQDADDWLNNLKVLKDISSLTVRSTGLSDAGLA